MIPFYRCSSGYHSFRSAFVILAMTVLTVGLAAPAMAGPVKVTASDADGLSLEAVGLETTWREVSLRGGEVTLFEPRIPGLGTTGEPGGVGSPITGGWFIVPPGKTPRVRIIQEDWRSAGNRPLMVQPIPIMVQGEDADFRHTGEILVLPDEPIPTEAPIPVGVLPSLSQRGRAHGGAALELGEVRWWRGRRIASWRLNALRHDGRIALESLADGSWEIVFEADKSLDQDTPKGQDAKFTDQGDDRFGGLFLNGHLADELPTEAVYRGLERPRADKSGAHKGTLLGNMEGRISIPSTRLYRVTAERMRDLGFLPEGDVAESQIRLYQRRYLPRLDDGSGEPPYAEIEVPIRMVGDGGNFDGGEFFVFYGLRSRDDTDFTADVGQGPEAIFGCGDNNEYNNGGNIYWVAAAEPDLGEEWARMEVQSLPAATGTPLEGYRRSEHFEEQVSYRQNVYSLSDDRLHLNHRRDAQVSVLFSPLWSPNTTGSNIEIEIEASTWSFIEQTLYLELVTDNTLVTSLGNSLIDSEDPVTREFTAPASAFAGDVSKLVVTNANDSQISAWLNWVKLEYDALYQAVGNRLDFHGGQTAGPRPMEITGFTNDDLGLVEVTDPRNPVWVDLAASNLPADGDGYMLSIMPDQSAGARHFTATASFSTTGVGEFNHYNATLAADQMSPLVLEDGSPDLLVITHPDFRDAAQRWIDHRRQRAGGDLNVHVVEVQDIYDWYSGGMKDPWALKRLSTHAINQWGTWSLMIIGDANENARELGVLPDARDWSRDWVPTHLHIQDTGQYPAEVLATDKWYTTFEAGMTYPLEDFPAAVFSPWQMYSGRLPCNSVEELDVMIDKIIQVENVQPDQDWRRRLILMADDAWSNGYGSTANQLTYRSWEKAFEDVERDIMRPLWEAGTPVSMEVDTLFLDNYLNPVWVNQGSPIERGVTEYQGWVEDTDALDDLRAAMNSGGLMLHYQGHANNKVLCSEYWFEDLYPVGRRDIEFLSNADKPWVFFGMGCHISDWAQDPVRYGVASHPPSLGEKFFYHPGGGASATYGSSGFEYISPNRDFGEYMMRRWIEAPPNAMQVPEGTDDPMRSRWMLGELLWYSEADMLAIFVGATHREMIAQYQLLGDPLMVLDAGPAEVSASLVGSAVPEIEGEVDIAAIDASGVRTIQVVARDEAGIDRLLITDSTGADLTAAVVTETLPEGETDHQRVDYSLEVPIRPFAHQMTVEVFDTGAPLDSDPHYSLILNVPHEAVFSVAGEDIEPGQFVFAPDEPVEFQFTLTSGAWLDDSLVYTLTGDNVEVSAVVIEPARSSTISGSFTATAETGTSGDRSVILDIGGFETTFLLEDDGAELPPSSITRLLNYPNPMRDGTRFVYETSASSGEGQVRIFSVAGRTVANIPFSYSGGQEGYIEWDGRDNEGDGLANGTYLYRIEMSTPSGMLVSPMQRLVVMN